MTTKKPQQQRRASVVQILEVLNNAEDVHAYELDDLFDKKRVGDLTVTRNVLRDAVHAYSMLLKDNPARAARGRSFTARLHENGGLIQWRSAYAGGPYVPRIVVRLDRYAEALGITRPEDVAANGRRYGEQHLTVTYEKDRVVIDVSKLANDADAAEEE